MLTPHSLMLQELEDFFDAVKEPKFRAKQLLDWVYQKGVVNIAHLTNFSKTLRQNLAEKLSLSSLKLKEQVRSQDGETIKFLWELIDGKLIESVLIYAPDRRTVCVSSQVGCPARCAFCASGKKGLIRHLHAGEIVEQIFLIDRWLKTEENSRVSHVVFMGMGEPFENYDEVVKAIRFLTDPLRMHLSQRRITVSTVGIVSKMRQFADEQLQVNLALSLHAPNQKLRRRLIPFAAHNDLSELLEAARYFTEMTGRDLTFEYTLMAGINDSLEHAEELASLVQNQRCTINLIPYNPVDGLRLDRPSKEAIEAFRSILMKHKVPTTWRYTKGKDIAAACGQLALRQIT